jgi:hypothetical protein
MKSKATPVITDPDTVWAQAWIPAPKITSDNPHTDPSITAMANCDRKIDFSMECSGYDLISNISDILVKVKVNPVLRITPDFRVNECPDPKICLIKTSLNIDESSLKRFIRN